MNDEMTPLDGNGAASSSAGDDTRKDRPMPKSESNNNSRLKIPAVWILSAVVAMGTYIGWLTQGLFDRQDKLVAAQMQTTRVNERMVAALTRIDEGQRANFGSIHHEHQKLQETADGISFKLGDRRGGNRR